ncbi:MAG: 2Fe-2S iron-sulfur cluster binding domain-containing protein [Verrucomicrobiaceae bacterium]|nr:MAG: 2Fe-2S iron-sulfur cluster binding domain-containing protein [Verrucomicrobiaceae bacterium]
MESISSSQDPPDRELSGDEEALMKELERAGLPRREFLKIASLTGTGLLGVQLMATRSARAQAPAPIIKESSEAVAAFLPVDLHVNGTVHKVKLDPRTALLDALRETLGLTGTKKGCDHGQCGACTVIVDGKRVLSCLTLAAQAEGKVIRTVEGLAGDNLHPMQEAFIKHDSFQCGYCTPGQLCSAVALLDEAQRGEASFVTSDLSSRSTDLTEDEIRERMSGNICRCAAYPQIVAAIREVQSGGESARTWGFAPCQQLAETGKESAHEAV